MINTSFQPTPLQPLPSSGTSTAPDEGVPPLKKVKLEGRKKNRDRKEKSRKEKDEKYSSKVVPIQPKPRSGWFEECGLAPENAYHVDPRADHSNLQYGALYSGDVAIYRRRFGVQCMGLGPHQTIEWTDNRGRKDNKKRKDKVDRYFVSGLPESQSFLHVAPHNHSTRNSGGSGTHAPFFMALEPAGRETSGEEEATAHGLSPEAYISQQTAMYNRSLQEDSHNVVLWLEFLDFQTDARVWTGEERRTTGKALRATNERKLAIFERALESNPASVELLVGHLALLQEMGRDPQIILKQWKDLVFRMPNKPLLWIKYSEFCRMQLTTFSTSSLAGLYQKSITTLTAIQEGVIKSHQPEPNTAPQLLALFIQYCHSLAEAGQSEKAIACFQALLEYNLCCPDQLKHSDDTPITYKQNIAFFEPFWDSSAPRLGEDGASGWKQWMAAAQGGQPLQSLLLINAHFLTHSSNPGEEKVIEDDERGEDPEIALVASRSLPEAWLSLEAYRDQHDVLPYQGPEDDLTDPERTVLFEDVSRCLFTLQDDHLLVRLVLQFLQFLGAPIPGSLSLDHLPHLISSHLQCALDALAPPHALTTLFQLPQQTLHISIMHKHNACSVGTGYRAVSTSDLLQHSNAGHSTPQGICKFVSNLCNQVLPLFTNPAMQTIVAQAWIAFEVSLLVPVLCETDTANPAKMKHTQQGVKAVQKLVKCLLKLEAHRNNLSLWDTCCQLELLLVGSKEATAMYENVLSLHRTISSELLPLYQHFCEVLMGLRLPLTTLSSLQPNHSHALHVTMCVGEGKYTQFIQDNKISPSNVLRIRHQYEQKAESELSLPLTFCHAYFEYISKDVQTACKVLKQYTYDLKDRISTLSSTESDCTTLRGQLYQAYYWQTHLLLSHAESNHMPPVLLWDTLEQALSSFSDDPFFLSAYADCQQPLYLIGKLRKYFDAHAPKAETAIPWVHAVRAEVARYHRVKEGGMGGGQGVEVPSGLVHRIRAILARATQSSSGRGCPLLWRLAISFEVRSVCVASHDIKIYIKITYICIMHAVVLQSEHILEIHLLRS